AALPISQGCPGKGKCPGLAVEVQPLQAPALRGTARKAGIGPPLSLPVQARALPLPERRSSPSNPAAARVPGRCRRRVRKSLPSEPPPGRPAAPLPALPRKGERSRRHRPPPPDRPVSRELKPSTNRPGPGRSKPSANRPEPRKSKPSAPRAEEHTSELQS